MRLSKRRGPLPAKSAKHCFHIQPFNALIIITQKDHKIVAASTNIKSILNIPAKELLGKVFNDAVQVKITATIKKSVKMPVNHTEVATVKIDEKPYWIIVSSDEEFVYCDFEEIDHAIIDEATVEHTLDLIQLLNQIEAIDSRKELYKVTLEMVMQLTHFDSVILCHYDENDVAEIVAQKRRRFMPSFKGNEFAVDDLPLNLRKTYRVKPVRYVPNITYKKVSIVTAPQYRDKLNLELSVTLGVAVKDRDNIRRMKAKSAASFPIIIGNFLWGILLLQSKTTKYLPAITRRIIFVITNILSNKIEQFDIAEDNFQKKRILKLLDVFSLRMQETFNLVDTLKKINLNLLSRIIACDGVYINAGDYYHEEGRAFTRDEACTLYNKYKNNDAAVVKFTSHDCLQAVDQCDLKITSGLLIIVNKDLDIFILLTRKKDLNTTWSKVDLLAASQIKQKISDVMHKELLAKMAYRDPLTNLYNRRHLENAFSDFCDMHRKKRIEISCVLIDLDFFKAVNDTHGHDCGDALLVRFSKLLKSSFRRSDLVCRYGGEEFIVLMATTPENINKICEKFREKVSQHQFHLGKKTSLSITVSIGVASVAMSSKKIQLKKLIATADDHLYQAKENGRNQVCY